METPWLAAFWAFLVVFALFVYLVRDGFDLGVGILFGLTRDRALRDTMVKAISPFWDGNEVWLVLVGAGLFAAFPGVYAIVLPAFYLPLTVMLLALVFRGVSFEFRHYAGSRSAWDWGFGGGSFVIAFVQGAALGGLHQGIPVAGGAYAGGALGWLTPFTVFCGLALAIGDALLGAAWLVLKTEGALRERAYCWLAFLLPAFLAALCGVAAWLLAIQPQLAGALLQRGWVWLPPLLALAGALGLWIGIRRRRDGLPYAMAVLLFLSCFLAVAGSLWPYLIPFTVTIGAAAAPLETLRFLLPGGVIVFPLVLLYAAVVAWVMRGKL